MKVVDKLYDQAFEVLPDRLYPTARKVTVKSERVLKKRIAEVANEVGVTLSRRNAEPSYRIGDGPEATYCWDGETIAMGKRELTDIVHDIAHHQCSAASRRHLPEWGLGTSPDGTRDAKLAVDHPVAQREEECASILGILWEREIGMGWTYTMENHNWEGHKAMAKRAVRKLLRWGLIDNELRPLPNMRPAKTRV